METKNKTTEEITEEFFRKRFPYKYIYFEIQCGYFGEWVERFKSENPEVYMDSKSLKVWEEMKEESMIKNKEDFLLEQAREIDYDKKEEKWE